MSAEFPHDIFEAIVLVHGVARAKEARKSWMDAKTAEGRQFLETFMRATLSPQIVRELFLVRQSERICNPK